MIIFNYVNPLFLWSCSIAIINYFSPFNSPRPAHSAAPTPRASPPPRCPRPVPRPLGWSSPGSGAWRGGGMKSWGKSREDRVKSGETVGFCDILMDFGEIQARFWRHVGCFWGNLDQFFFGNIWETCGFGVNLNGFEWDKSGEHHKTWMNNWEVGWIVSRK